MNRMLLGIVLVAVLAAVLWFAVGAADALGEEPPKPPLLIPPETPESIRDAAYESLKNPGVGTVQLVQGLKSLAAPGGPLEGKTRITKEDLPAKYASRFKVLDIVV